MVEHLLPIPLVRKTLGHICKQTFLAEMPESFLSLPEARCSALEEFFRSSAGAPNTRCQSRRMPPSIHINCDHDEVQPYPTSDGNDRNRQRGARTSPRQNKVDDEPQTPPQTQQGPGRKPGTSQYYGVRFRPDLNKWVAEIRVAEWKAVDKKVWLGTFETEQAAARGVDLARKLLKCTKKHPPNLPCAKLEAYSKQIPAHLILSDLTATSMFKSATLFIKHECKEYAASFNDEHITPAATTPQGSSEGQFFNQTYENTSTNSSDALDLYDSDEADFSDMILEYYTGESDLMTINDHSISTGLEVDSFSSGLPMTNYNCELSSSSSCNSTVMLEALQGQDNMMVPDWEMTDCGCKDGLMMFQSCSALPEMIEGMSMMETTLTDVGTVSQLWADDASLFHIWPGLRESSPPASLTQLPDLLCGLTSYMSSMPSMHGGYVAPMDLDPWSLQGAHYPFQHGPSGWR